MNRYELFIECKACREASHHNCSGIKRGLDNNVQIKCMCLICKGRNSKQFIMKKRCNDSSDLAWSSKKNRHALEVVGEPVPNAFQDIQPTSPSKEDRRRR